MKILNTFLLTILVSTATAFPEAGETGSGVRDSDWELALNSGDTRDLVDLYSLDAVVIPPSLEILDAPAEIRQYWKTLMAKGTGNFRVQTINLRQQGDTIYQSAIWIATSESNGVKTELDGEMTNIITRQDDGSWKITLQSWN